MSLSLSEGPLLAYKGGRSTYAVLERATHGYGRAMARWAAGRWSTQRLFGVDDLEQLVRVELYLAVGRYRFRCATCTQWSDDEATHKGHGCAGKAAPSIVAFVHYQVGRRLFDALRRETTRRSGRDRVALPEVVPFDESGAVQDGARSAELRLAVAECRRRLSVRERELFDQIVSGGYVRADASRVAALREQIAAVLP